MEGEGVRKVGGECGRGREKERGIIEYLKNVLAHSNMGRR